MRRIRAVLGWTRATHQRNTRNNNATNAPGRAWRNRGRATPSGGGRAVAPARPRPVAPSPVVPADAR